MSKPANALEVVGDPEARAKVRRQLATIFGDASFASAARHRRFLEFVVEQTLAGNQTTVKEQVIGAEVFGREPDYDPRADAIVRVEAAKLRNRLAAYYEGPGKNDSVFIELPKGAYVPRFSFRPAPGPQPNRRYAAAAAILLVIAGAIWLVFRTRTPDRPPLAEIPSVAVLPFLNLSSDPENEYFSVGLTEQLTDTLTRVGGLRVVSRTSAFAFKGKDGDVKDIGAKLGVAAVVEGSVRKSGDRLRITAQLIQARDGFHLWSETFERQLSDVFQIQDEISQAVTRALKVNLTAATSNRVFKRSTNDIEAFDLYLRGLHARSAFAPDGPPKSLAFFEQAVAKDPRFALAYVGIASAHGAVLLGDQRPPADAAGQVESHLKKALAIDPNLSEAYALLGGLQARYEWKWAEAEQTILRAIDLNPYSAAAHHSYAQSVLLPLRRFDEALAHNRLAVELEPYLLDYAVGIPWILDFQGKTEDAIAKYQELLASRQRSGVVVGGLAYAYLHAGQFEKAAELFEEIRPQAGGSLNFWAMLAYAYARAGRKAEALEIERRFSGLQYVPPMAEALLYLALDRIPEARRAAERVFQEHSANFYYMTLDPIFAPLRQDPEFAKLLRTKGLPF